LKAVHPVKEFSMKGSKKVKKAHNNLLDVRDSAFFDKLRQDYGIVPHDKKDRCSLEKLADVLELVDNDEVKKARVP
jgi:hypothetical protein